MEPGIEGKDDAHHDLAVLTLARNTQAIITPSSFTCANARSVAGGVPRSAAFSLARRALCRVTRTGIPAQKINSLGQLLLQSNSLSCTATHPSTSLLPLADSSRSRLLSAILHPAHHLRSLFAHLVRATRQAPPFTYTSQPSARPLSVPYPISNMAEEATTVPPTVDAPAVSSRHILSEASCPVH